MPFPALLRTGLLLSSLTVAATYTLYATNPAFRQFVDSTLDQISNLWSDLLATLSPEERQAQRERQRHVFLDELSSRGVAGAREAAAAVRPEGAVAVSGADAGPHSAAARQRRRALWEVAEQNAAEIMERARRANKSESAGPAEVSKSGSKHDSMISEPQAGNTLFSGFATHKPSTSAAEKEQRSIPTDLTPETALHSHPNDQTQSSSTSFTSAQADAESPILMTEHDHETDFNDAASSITASTETEAFSQILTPTSPSLRSVSELDNDDLHELDPLEYTHTDLGVEHVADPPVSGLDDLEDPDIEDIADFVRRAQDHGESGTPTTRSIHGGDVDDQDGMSVYSAAESAFSETGWSIASGDGDHWDPEEYHQVRQRL